MDQFDRATVLEEQIRELALRHREPSGPPATGHCLHCDQPLPEGKRWCDAECRDEWAEFRSRLCR